MDLPPAIECPVAETVSVGQAANVLMAMRQKFPSTAFVSARPAPICGLIQLELKNGNQAFTDKSARYLILGLVLDSLTGRTLDGNHLLNRD